MKSIVNLSALLAFLFPVLSFASVAAGGDLAPMTRAEENYAVQNIKPAIARSIPQTAGKSYCAAGSSEGIRFYIDSETRVAFFYPFVNGVEKGREAPALIQTGRTMPMAKEVEQTLRMYGMSGKASNETYVLQMLSHDAGAALTTIAVMSFYLNDQGDIDRDNSMLLLTDNRNGTYFVGTTKGCR